MSSAVTSPGKLPNPLVTLLLGFEIMIIPPYCSSIGAIRSHGIPPLRPSYTAQRHHLPTTANFEQIHLVKTQTSLKISLIKAGDSKTERLILAFCEQRFKDLRKGERKGQFGRVLLIIRVEYGREVTEANKVDGRDEPEDEDDKYESIYSRIVLSSVLVLQAAPQ